MYDRFERIAACAIVVLTICDTAVLWTYLKTDNVTADLKDNTEIGLDR